MAAIIFVVLTVLLIGAVVWDLYPSDDDWDDVDDE